jgi:hypothetical protein
MISNTIKCRLVSVAIEIPGFYGSWTDAMASILDGRASSFAKKWSGLQNAGKTIYTPGRKSKQKRHWIIEMIKEILQPNLAVIARMFNIAGFCNNKSEQRY